MGAGSQSGLWAAASNSSVGAAPVGSQGVKVFKCLLGSEPVHHMLWLHSLQIIVRCAAGQPVVDVKWYIYDALSPSMWGKSSYICSCSGQIADHRAPTPLQVCEVSGKRGQDIPREGAPLDTGPIPTYPGFGAMATLPDLCVRCAAKTGVAWNLKPTRTGRTQTIHITKTRKENVMKWNTSDIYIYSNMSNRYCA